MEKKKNIETKETEERKPPLDWNKWDGIISVAIIAFVIIVPLGGIEYLNGRFSTSSIFLDACFIYPTLGISIIVFVIISAIQLLCNWKRYTRRKRTIKIVQIGIPIVFIASFAISILTPIETYIWQPGYKPFTYGFRDRIRIMADVKDIRDWLRTLSKEDCKRNVIRIPSEKWPKSLKIFYPHHVNLGLDENGNPKVRLTWGGGFGHWGFEIGMEDMEIPPSDFSQFGEYRLSLEPGAYVWHELQ